MDVTDRVYQTSALRQARTLDELHSALARAAAQLLTSGLSLLEVRELMLDGVEETVRDYSSLAGKD